MKSTPFAVMCILLSGAFLVQACKSSSSTAGAAQQSSQSSGAQVASTSPTAPPAAVPPQPVVASEKPFDPFEGFVLGGSLGEMVDGLKMRGFPSNAGCDDNGNGFEDCYSRKGTPGDNDFEVVALHIKLGAGEERLRGARLYGVEYLFPSEKYDTVLKGLTELHGTAVLQKGVRGWKSGAHSQIALSRDAETNAGQRLSKAVFADITVVAEREVGDAVNGRGRYAQ